jgi:hypothetical protein
LCRYCLVIELPGNSRTSLQHGGVYGSVFHVRALIFKGISGLGVVFGRRRGQKSHAWTTSGGCQQQPPRLDTPKLCNPDEPDIRTQSQFLRTTHSRIWTYVDQHLNCDYDRTWKIPLPLSLAAGEQKPKKPTTRCLHRKNVTKGRKA